jgi:hypothetical protein
MTRGGHGHQHSMWSRVSVVFGIDCDGREEGARIWAWHSTSSPWGSCSAYGIGDQ